MQARQHAALNLRSPTVWLCGGGTGGHVYPALAVAAELRAGSRLAYVGSADGMEAGLVGRESDLPFHSVPAAALRGRGPLTLARNALTLLNGTLAARALIARERPDAILGTGGYVCVPVFLAARVLGVPTAVYLPDVVPGLAVRMLGRIATTVACSVADSAPYFKKTIDNGQWTMDNVRTTSSHHPSFVVTGYPVRPELFTLDRGACRATFELSDDLPVLLVYGGSRGARSINQAIAALLPELLEIAQVIHICGREGDEQFLQAAAEQIPADLRARYRLSAYLHSEARRDDQVGHSPERSMTTALGAADLALCRSGASTLGELPAVGLPAVLVPYPYVHQDENADYLVRHGAALKVHDHAMLGAGRPAEGPLFKELKRLIVDMNERAGMARHCRSLARPDAARRLADILLALAAGRRAA